MKKLGIIVALALVVTIGGAYATWNYATSLNGSVINGSATAGLEITEITQITVDNGTITIIPDSVKIIFDDTDGDHVVDTDSTNVKGTFTITFEGSYNNSVKNAPKGINIKLSASGDYKYNNQSILTYTDLTAGYSVGNAEGENGVAGNQWKVNARDLIQINSGLTLSDVAAYNAFNDIISGQNVTITAAPASDSVQTN